MWYFIWILCLGFAVWLAVISAVRLERKESTENSER